VSATPRGRQQLPVLIFGPHIAALGVLRRLTGRGIRCYVVDQTDDIIVRSRWYRPAERTMPETSDSDVLAGYLSDLRLERAVLIPCSDNWTLAASGLPEELRERFSMSLPPRDVIEQFVDKERFSKLTDRLAIPRPRTVRLPELEDLAQLSDHELANAFLKPTDPQLHRRHFGTKGTFVHSREEADRVLRAGAAVGVSFIFQEWISGDMGSTVLVDGFVDRAGSVAGMVLRRRLRVAPPMVGNTVSSVSIPLDEARQATDGVRRLLAETGFRGAFNVEFKLDVRDGQFKVIELNPRPAWYIATIANLGLDIPWSIYRDAQGLEVERARPYAAGRYGLYEFRDAVAIGGYLRRLRRPDGAVIGPWLHGDRTVFWWRDPLPAFHGTSRFLSRRLGRKRRPAPGAGRTAT
jgi:predicted ATP-grasp superfamily ATP-dependent carboligase